MQFVSMAWLRLGEAAARLGLRSGEGGIRTRDTTIFSRVLYQLSYLARQRARRRGEGYREPEGLG
jgi:hypothetical protein